MFCIQCRTQVVDGALFCHKCGAKLDYPKENTAFETENSSTAVLIQKKFCTNCGEKY